MLVKSVKSKLERAGWSVQNRNNEFWARKPGNRYTISFYRNGGTDSHTAVCLRVQREDDRDELQSDYFGGCFADSISKAIGYAERWQARDEAERRVS